MQSRALLSFFIVLNLFPFSSKSAESPEVYWLGEARGPFTTGTHTTMWVDDSREELTTAVINDKRRIMIQAWYPAEVNDNAAPAPYILFDLEIFQEYVQSSGSSVAARPTRSVLEAPILNTPTGFPVLLYNHGGNAPLFSGTAQTEFLASHGYVVVSVSHSDDAALIGFPDGSDYDPLPVQQRPPENIREEMSELEAYEWGKENVQSMHEWHVQDMIFAINKLEKLNQSEESIFYSKLNLEKLGAFGWSRGGATAFQLTVDDERVKAAVNLDGYLWGRPVEYSGSKRPLLMIESTDIYFDPLEDSKADPDEQEMLASVEADIWRMFRLSTNDWYRAKIVGSAHPQFSDFPLANASPPPEFIPPQKTRDITNQLLLEFFGLYIQGEATTKYLSGQDTLPELRVITELEAE